MKLVAWLSSMLAALDGSASAPACPVAGRNPVILVHGIYSSSADMTRMACNLRRQGWEVYTPDITPADGRVGLEQLAAQLAAYAAVTVPGRRFDLVGFSMGGLISRYYMQRLGGLLLVDRFVTVAAPHNGTLLANFNAQPGGRQMRPGSGFLRDLASDSGRLGQVQFTSLYTPLDLMILPARSSAMPEASNQRIWAASHPSLILEKRCIRAVAQALLGELPVKGQRGVEAALSANADVPPLTSLLRRSGK